MLPSAASWWMSWRRIGIRGFTWSRILLPLTIDWPNLSPSPVSAWAAALSVRFTLTGSTLSVSSTTVSNTVLNSVVTDVASITDDGLIRCGAGSFGDVSDTYLLPNTVVAWTLAMTLAGMRSTNSGSTSRANRAAGLPRGSTS